MEYMQMMILSLLFSLQPPLKFLSSTPHTWITTRCNQEPPPFCPAPLRTWATNRWVQNFSSSIQRRDFRLQSTLSFFRSRGLGPQMPTSSPLTTRSSFPTQDFPRSIRRIHPLGHYKSSKYQNVLLRKKSRVFEKRHLKCIFQVLFHDAFTFSKAPLLHISTTTIISFFPPKRDDSRVKRTKIFLVFLQLRCFKHGNFSQIVTYFHESKVSQQMKAAFLCALDATTIFNTFLPIHVGVLWHYWRCSSSCCLIYCSLLFYVYPKTNVSHQEKEQRTTKIHFFSVPFLTFSCRSVQPDDAGKYECQVSTLPKKSHFLHLSVIGKFVHSKKIGFA